ncbi:MAG: hypothetical protein PHU53_07730, partial [Thermoplasmata archaeon]|nr:hypothetical protein [Thermoplasmata archaeon]
MTNMKKFLFFGCLIVVALLVVGCKGDTVAPVLAIEYPTITHVVNADVDLLQGITATDNNDSAADIVIEISDLGGYDKDVVGTYDVTVKATDKAGNSVTQTITVTVTEVPVEDTVAPVLTIGSASITHQTNATVDLLEDVTATDDVDAAADITIEVSNFNGYDKSVAGTYVITVKATDKSGNFATGTITVVVKSDVLAPMLTSAVSDVIHIAGETVDLTRGLEGVDNVDGVNVIFTVSDLLSYNKEVPGEYTIEITMSDAAGNEAAPFTRNVIVQEGYARAEMTSFEGETIRYEALYNPQVLNGVTGTGYNSAYDGHYVNVLSKEYLEWLLTYAPERIGSGMGWNVIAVTDSSNKIVYVRHWNSGEAYKDESNNLVSIPAVDWCSGTVRTWTETVGEETVGMSNAKYSAGEMGMMMANINKWVPENGHIFIFMNWTTIGKDASNNVIPIANSADMPRSMGARYIMASDENGDDVMDYALGRDLFILNSELSDQAVRTTFDAANPFPIIAVPSSRFITANGAWKNDYVNVVYLNEHDEQSPFDPLDGITANDGKGTDITANVTYKMYRYQTTTLAYGLQTSLPITDPRWEENLGAENTWKLADNEVTVEQALNPVNDDYYF